MPKQIDHNQRRDEIARAACLVIAEKGFAQTKLVDIAKTAGCTTGALRHYFETKDDILNAATNYSRLHSRVRLDNASRRVPYSLVDTLFETLPTNPAQTVFIKVWMEMNVRSMGSAVLAAEAAASARNWAARIKEELVKARENGQIDKGADVDAAGELMALGIIGLINRAIMDPEKWPRGKQRTTLEQLVERVSSGGGKKRHAC